MLISASPLRWEAAAVRAGVAVPVEAAVERVAVLEVAVGLAGAAALEARAAGAWVGVAWAAALAEAWAGV